MWNKMIVVGAMLMALSRVSLAADTCAAAGDMDVASGPVFTGVVLATTNASRYTYVQVKADKETIWAAGPVFQVKVGDRVTVGGAMPVANFKSKVLNRTFDKLYMAGSIMPAGEVGASCAKGTDQLPAGHPALTGKTAAPMVIESIQKPSGGKTVAEVWADKSGLSGKTVIVRAKAIKVSKKILGHNWLHVRDGSGVEGTNDLTVTTKDEVAVGDVITLSGTLNTDKDFGSGYRYDVILEDAVVVGK